MELDPRFQKLDEEIIRLGGVILPLAYTELGGREEQKRAFLAREISSPNFNLFQKKDLEYDPSEAESTLRSLDVPEGELGDLYRGKLEIMLQDNEIVRSRGDSEIVRAITRQQAGIPSTELVAAAETLLREIPAEEAPLVLSPDVMEYALRTALSIYGLKDWTVEQTDKEETMVIPAKKKITICRNRKFATSEPVRQAIHEAGVHAVRGENGYQQPLKIFAVGLPGYYPHTEEGLASHVEEITGVVSNELKRNYAGRVLAVDSIVRNFSFPQTFDLLKDHRFSDDQAWKLAVRAHRGGGFIKDHGYLEGVQRVRHFMEEGGDLRTLYVGKIGIEDVPLTQRLLAEGVLKQPKHLPSFLRDR